MVRIARRPFVKMLIGGAAWAPAMSAAAAGGPYRVGIGSASSSYEAARRAIEASGEWPSSLIAGRTVVIKPNLVLPVPAHTGVTTDPEVVRAVVDLALADDAAAILIIESGTPVGKFSTCGYSFFESYAPNGRVALVNLDQEEFVLATVPNGLAYRRIYAPLRIVNPEAVFVSVGKLKTHLEVGATLSVKNLFGLPPIKPYYLPGEPWFRPRFHLHDRGVHQVIVDMHLMRRIQFALVDGMVGMEGDGPTEGSAVTVGAVLAGANAVAVDRAGLWLMGISQERIQHLAYAAVKGLGPGTLSEVELAGDLVTPRPFLQPALPPRIWRPVAFPSTFSPGSGQRTSLAFQIDDPCSLRVEILQTLELMSRIRLVRTLQDFSAVAPGLHWLEWDGRNDAGGVVSSGVYTARLQARFADGELVSYATGWISVTT